MAADLLFVVLFRFLSVALPLEHTTRTLSPAALSASLSFPRSLSLFFLPDLLHGLAVALPPRRTEPIA